VRRERLRQDARHLPGRQYNHPVREPPLAAAPVPEISDRQVWSYRRAQVTAPVSARPGEGIEWLVPERAPTVLPKLTEINLDLVNTLTDDFGCLQLNLDDLPRPLW
jgi:hypothetical protein